MPSSRPLSQYAGSRAGRLGAWAPGRLAMMLEAGESIVSLAKWLGHSDPAFTLRTYTHFMPQADARGLSAIEAWFTDLG